MRYIVCAIAWVVGWGLGQPALAQPPTTDPRLAQVFANWKERYEKFKTVRYTITGTVEFKDKPLGPDDDPLPPGNPVRPKRVVLLLDLERKRLRLEKTEDSRGPGPQYTTRVTTDTFDGTEARNFMVGRGGPGSRDTDLSIARGNLSQGQIEAYIWPVFFAHGIIPTSHAPLAPPSLARPFDPDLWSVHAEQTMNGRRCLVLRTEPLAAASTLIDELWVDPGRGWSVIRSSSSVDLKPWDRLDIESKQTEYGWLLDRWTFTWTLNGQVRRVQKLRVESFEADPAAAGTDFTIPETPGMTISVSEYPELGTGLNPAYPSQKTYRVSPSGSWELLSARGFTTREGKLLPPGGPDWVWWSAGAAAAGLVAVAVFLRRRRTAAA